MILICNACRARYLVPASVFTGGARRVRCARCAHTWDASLTEQVEEPAPRADPSAALEKQPPSTAPLPQSPEVKSEAPSLPAQPPLPQQETSPASAPVSSQLPVIRKKFVFPFYLKTAIGVLIGGILLGVLLLLIVMRDEFAEYHPWAEKYYNMVGLQIAHVGDGLSIKNVHSERRFQDGLVQLIVIGEIHNESNELLILPALLSTAIGADGKHVQKWRIDLSETKLSPSASLSFKSVVRSPSEAIAEVNLRFVEVEKDGSLHE